MAISGLHIGLIASLGLVGFSGLWRCLPPLCGRIPARVVGAGAGLVFAFGYALMAGMGLPTQSTDHAVAAGIGAIAAA